MALRNYSIDDLHVSFNGFLINKGLMNVSVAQENDAFDYTVGSGGEVARIRRVDYRATVTVTLIGTSPDNAVLSALHEADRRSPNGTGVGVLYVQQGSDIFVAEKAWIMRAPDRSYETEAIGDNEWVFQCADLKRVDGGNAE